MKPDPKFNRCDKAFWACVRSLSQDLGYTVRGQDRIKVPTINQMRDGLSALQLNPEAVIDGKGYPTPLGAMLQKYFEYRAEILRQLAQPNLMTVREAKAMYDEHRAKLKPSCPLPMNKQTGRKKAPAYLTGLVNMLIEHHSKRAQCDYDPRKLTTVTRNGIPLRTLARRVDGAFPSHINPIAVWEIKEYYYTTTFGSRIADGVYESQLDGMELEELREHERVDVKHYLFVDARDTWWNDGKAYLCRIVDMLNMGYVDEVLFGKEVVQEVPRLVSEWLKLLHQRSQPGAALPPRSR